MWGIGFKTADTIARSVGIAPDSPERIKAGLAYTLSEAADDGHCYPPAPNLIADAATILDVPAGLITPCLDELAAAEGVVREEVPASAGLPGSGRTADPRRLPAALLSGRTVPGPRSPAPARRPRRLPWRVRRRRLGQSPPLAARPHRFQLAPEQADAVRLALTAKVAVLTGGPGCGKSFTVRSVVELARAKGAKIVLAAPTGRAAKRLAELAGTAATIHRLLQLRPGGDPAFDADKPLDADLVVVDETSMVDVILANKLVKAVPPGAHLLLVGDVDQLPSVGAGEVLRDLLAAGSLPAVRLTKIFRQAQQSGIVTNAHRINAGQQPRTGFGDFFRFGGDDTEQTPNSSWTSWRGGSRPGSAWTPAAMSRCSPHASRPGRRRELNELLQDALTPSRDGAPERRYGGRVFGSATR